MNIAAHHLSKNVGSFCKLLFVSFTKSTSIYLAPSDELKTRQLQFLSRRGLYWIYFVLLASLVIVYWAHHGGTDVPNGEVFRLDMKVWAGMLWVLTLPGLFLYRVVSASRDGDTFPRKKVEWLSAAWILFFTAVAAWWSLDTYALENQTAGRFLGNRSFIWLMAMGHLVTVVLLASNWVAVFSVLVVGCLIPGLYALYQSPGPVSNLYWLTGQMTAFFIVTSFFHADQRRLLHRQISLEQEKQRSASILMHKSELLANFSHDLFNPLTALELQLKSVLRSSDDLLVKKKVLQAFLQTRAMVRIIETARDLAHAESGEFKVNKREAPLREILSDVISTYSALAENDKIKFRSYVPDVLVKTDKVLASRIVENLVSNAFKYSRPKERPHVLLTARRRNNQLEIKVFDNGIGIKPEHQSDIFREGVQLNNPERDRRKGIGLGLSLVRAFSKLLGHHISVDSRIDCGSVFTVTVPYVGKVPKELRPAAQIELPMPIELGSSAIELNKMKIILVEDEASELADFSELLESWGAEVLPAKGYNELSELLPQYFGYPDLLITDYRLVEKNGSDIIRLVRSTFRNVPAIVWSADQVELPSDIRNVIYVQKGHLEEMEYAIMRFAPKRDRVIAAEKASV